jgi:hypothetical protein
MSWPKRDFVQVAVLDEGIGIRKSLGQNERFRFSTDAEALREAIKPGVSRNLGRTISPERLEKLAEERHSSPYTLMQNAGYGLYMISSICRAAGQFLITSGNASLGYIGSAEVQSAGAHHGTALRIVLQPSEVEEALKIVFEQNGASGIPNRNMLLSPSTLKRLGLDTLTGGGEQP